MNSNRGTGPGSLDESTEAAQTLARLNCVAQAMDSAVRIPGTRIRIGLDALIGLVPGVGDGLSALVSLWIVSEAHRLGAGSGTLARMLINVAVDTTIGAIPLAGDLFDIGWKTNQRNVRLLAQDLRTTDGPEVDHRP